MQLWKCLQGVKKKHSEISIPFRESKLTHLLLPGLFRNGLSGVAMIACVNPHADDYDENISILGKFVYPYDILCLTYSIYRERCRDMLLMSISTK
jgi:Kinesin motor domain